MTNIISLTARRAAEAAVKILAKQGVPFTKNGRPRINPNVAKRFYAFVPCFTTDCGPKWAKLREVTFSKINGETIAYYDLEYRNHHTGLMQSTTYLYAVRGGQLAQLRRYETRYWR